MEAKKLKVMQIRIRMYVLKDIPAEKIQTEIAAFLDRELVKDFRYAEFHQRNQYKLYCYDALWPVEQDKIYKKDKLYTLTIRTVDPELARYFTEQAVNGYTQVLKALTAEVKIIPLKPVDLLYSLSPVVIKCQSGRYWRESLSVEQYEERLRINLLKKWQQFYGEKFPEDFEMFTGIEFLNKVPVKVEYKNIHLLGDKVRLHIAENKESQMLAYMAIAVGVGEMNSRGMGICNYRWI